LFFEKSDLIIAKDAVLTEGVYHMKYIHGNLGEEHDFIPKWARE
jgi:hypothetical protein